MDRANSRSIQAAHGIGGVEARYGLRRMNENVDSGKLRLVGRPRRKREAGEPRRPAHPSRPEPRCATCSIEGLENSEEVATRILRLAASGWSIAAIHRAIWPLMATWPAGKRVSYHSLRRHVAR